MECARGHWLRQKGCGIEISVFQMTNMKGNCQAIVIGVSAGGLRALTILLSHLPANYSFPVVVVQHRAEDQGDMLEEVLQAKCKIAIRQADEKEKMRGGIVYIAPAGYHLLIEQDRTFSLSCDERVMYSRPSIDVMFESAADVFGKNLVGVILTGSNHDGAVGISAIHALGGVTIAQSPKEAEHPVMPQAAIDKGGVQQTLTLEEIKAFLLQLD